MRRRDFITLLGGAAAWPRAMKSFLVVAAIGATIATGALAQTPNLITEEMMVPASDPGIDIYVRNKRLAEMASFRPERTVLFVHGSTYPAETGFDLPLGGTSWMEYIPGRGYDVYLLDLRGYGKSTRPKEMSENPEANAPIVRTDTGVGGVSSVVDFILKLTGASRHGRGREGAAFPEDTMTELT